MGNVYINSRKGSNVDSNATLSTETMQNTPELDAEIAKSIRRNRRYGKVIGTVLNVLMVGLFAFMFYLLFVNQVAAAAICMVFFLIAFFVWAFAKGIAEKLDREDLITESVKQFKKRINTNF